jgi:hypothetical protein
VALWASSLIVHAQVFLNELYVRPQGNEDQYFELYNAGMTPANVGCYSVVTYFNNNGEQGFYVVDLPSVSIPARDFLLASASNPFHLRQGGQMNADVNWNAGNVYKYVYRNGSLQLDNTTTTVNDLFTLSGNNNGKNTVYSAFLFQGSTLMDAFLGASDTTLVPQFITRLGTLHHVSAQSNCGNIDYDFGAINAEPSSKFANVKQNAQPGKGYYREGNGPCPCQQNWIRAASASDHTPGYANLISGCGCDGSSLIVTDICISDKINYTITGGNLNAYPLSITLYNDLNGNGKLDEGDTAIATQSYAAYDGQRSFTKPHGADFFLLAIDAQGICSDKIVAVQCPANITLPVTITSFTVKKAGNNAVLNWETATEINNLGFYVERLQGSGDWQTISFVPSLALDGNSNATLAYSLSDLNTFNGISQYRLRQVDKDGRYKYSSIQILRNTEDHQNMVVYPNPTSNGSIQIVFSSSLTTRDISLSDLSGRLIKQWKGVTDNHLQIDNLNAGAYMLHVVSLQTGAVTTQKVIVNGR